VARFVASPTSADPINGEGTNVIVSQNVKNSDQVVWKNLTVVDDVSNKTLIVRNVSQGGNLVSLRFTAPPEQLGDSFFDHGSVRIALGAPLFALWIANGAQGNNIRLVFGSTTGEVQIIGDGSSIDGLPMNFNDEYVVTMQFGPQPGAGVPPCEDDRTVFDVLVSAFEGPTLLGGNTYEVRPQTILPSPEVMVQALDPQIDCTGGGVGLQVVSGVPAGSTLQWFLDDVAIAGAVGGAYSATQSGQYSVLMTYSNGCDRFSQPVAVHVGTPPVNDDPCAATIVGLGVPVGYDITCATAQPGEVTPGPGSGALDGCASIDGWCADDSAVQNSVWYRFTAPPSGRVSIHVDGSHEVDHDLLTNTQLAVWQAGDCADYGTYSLVAASDDSGNHGVWGTAPALHGLSGLTSGADYAIQIDGYLGGAGMGTLLVEEVASPTFCDGTDGALAACPCANFGAPDSGCDNAQGTGGVRIDVVAQATSPNSATLTGTGFSTMGAPTAIVLRSNALDPSSPVVFGDGLRCINASPLVRLAATVATAGVSTHAFGHGAMAGTGSFFYQIWYRNTPAAFCTPESFNLSNGTQLTW
jgi:hypothetical protein